MIMSLAANPHAEFARAENRPARTWLIAGSLLLVLAAVYATEWLAASLTAVDASSPIMAWAVAVDLVILLPLAYYLVAVRVLGWPWLSTVPVALVGLFTARALVPDAGSMLTQLEWLLIPAELMILGVIALRARAGWRRFATESGSVDAAAAMRRAAVDVVGQGRAAEILATELSIFHHALAMWRQPLPEPTPTRFFAREKSGYGLLVGGVAVATAVEIIPVHLLLSHFWSPIAGWIATGLALYGAIWLLGDWQAARRMPIELLDDALRIRVGLRWRVDVPYSCIETLRPVAASEVKVDDALQAFSAGRPSHCLELRRPVTAIGPYGLRKSVDRIALLVDEPQRFQGSLRSLVGDATGGEAGPE